MGESFSISAEKMRDILEVSRLLAVTAEIDKLLMEIAKATQALLGAERASIFLHDSGTDELWTKVALGAGEIRVPAAAGIVGFVFKSNKILNIPDAYSDARFNREVDRRTGFVTRNLLTCPMFDLKGKAIGVIQAVNKIGGIFVEEDEQTLILLAAQCGVAIQRYHLQVDAIQVVELRREMDLAKGVQEGLFPKKMPMVPGLEAAAWNRPASVTGGDWYDLWTIDSNQVGVFVGDAAGHGLGPALEALQARTLARAMSDLNCDPRWILANVNQRLARDLKLGHFVTVFLGCFSNTGHLTWSSAGHGPVLYRRSPNAPVEIFEAPAPPIGVDDEFPVDQTTPVQIDPGGLLLVMTDGIFESQEPDAGDMFGVERVVQILDSCREAPPEQIVTRIREAVRVWQQKEEPHDDQTIVAIRRTS